MRGEVFSKSWAEKAWHMDQILQLELMRHRDRGEGEHPTDARGTGTAQQQAVQICEGLTD